MPDELFRVGRATVLRQLLELPALFRVMPALGADGPAPTSSASWPVSADPRHAAAMVMTATRAWAAAARHACSSRTISRLDTTVAPSHTAIANRSAGRS